MKSFKVNKNTLMSFRVFGLMIGVSFMVIGVGMFAPKIQAVGQVPSECVSTTNKNIKNTYYCNSACTRTSCISYCPSYSGYASIKVPFDMEKLQIKYKLQTRPVYIKVAGTNIAQWVNCGSAGCTGVLTDTSGAKFKKGDVLKITVKDREGNAIGFRSPDANNICGENNICREDGGKNGNPRTYKTFSIADIVKPSTGYKLLSKECYGDTARGDSDFDFNDYALVVFGKPIVKDVPKCVDLETQYVVGGATNVVEFVCKVQNADKCVFDINGKNVTADVKNGTCKIGYKTTTEGKKPVVCYAVKGSEKKTSNACTKTFVITNNTPVCKELKITSKSTDKRTYQLSCYVKDATTCKFDINGKIVKTKTVSNGKCVTDYTFSKSGNYNVSCLADNGTTKSSSETCKTLVHIPTDSAGDRTVPFVLSVIATAGVVAYFAKRQKEQAL